jgi:hypothetical protein
MSMPILDYSVVCVLSRLALVSVVLPSIPNIAKPMRTLQIDTIHSSIHCSRIVGPHSFCA